MSVKKKNNRTLSVIGLLLIVGAATGVWAYSKGHLFADDEQVEIAGAPVRRGPLVISVTERGNLTAKNSVSIKSEVEGRSTLLYLIDEGNMVEPGDLIAEIDTSEHVDRRVAQEISVQSGRAAATKAREGLAIQEIENESLIAKAEQNVLFARLELERFVGLDLNPELEKLSFEEMRELIEAAKLSDGNVGSAYQGGSRQQELQQFGDDILIRAEELKRSEDRYEWSSKLASRGFVERTELEADELAVTRAEISLEQAKRAMFLLKEYGHPKDWATLQGDLSEAGRQLLKSNKQAIAQLADYEAAKEATTVKLALEEEKLARILDQISKGKIHSPVSGMVVYGRTEGGRSSSSEPMQEGGEIRERQEIATIPGEGGMIAEASVHESVLSQVVEGLRVVLRIDALPGQEFQGEVTNVAVLPDKNSWWANPNLRLYKTEIVVDGGDGEMRPGMSCSIEILVQRIPDTLYVPIQAVHHTGSKAIAWVREEGSVVERVVEIGSHNRTWLEIKSGLEEGEVVLLSPPLGFQVVDDATPEEAQDLGAASAGSEKSSESKKPKGSSGSDNKRPSGR
ncbi:MAG: HlyD family secretion protein [Planctomycetota bacterium]|jgi:HlyD family secretion protein